jgi:UDP-2,3-diacylglucosamine hydrolase
MLHKLQDGALFIADAHYQKGVREDLYDFLLALEKGEIQTPQLIMMGDMFDLLVGSIDYTVRENQKIIRLINRLAQTKEILYIEGNHDFNLQKLFPKVLVIPRHKQPLHCTYHDKHIVLSHGDLYQGKKYHIYCMFIRNPFLLKILNFIDKHRHNFISKGILNEQKNKDICKKLNNFHRMIKQKSKNYDIASNRFDVICEGHHHMNKEYSLESCLYKLFASYACGKSYFTIDFKERIVFNQFTKG